ncbi:hypothetical protein [Streptomyces sp. TS71-3]|nr:hypothetical protein [Streptomyces sp. TS71-3]
MTGKNRNVTGDMTGGRDRTGRNVTGTGRHVTSTGRHVTGAGRG